MAVKVKKTFKNLLLPNHHLDSIIILQECSLDRGLQFTEFLEMKMIRQKT